jgi:hypothetical protein
MRQGKEILSSYLALYLALCGRQSRRGAAVLNRFPRSRGMKRERGKGRRCKWGLGTAESICWPRGEEDQSSRPFCASRRRPNVHNIFLTKHFLINNWLNTF